MGTHRSKAQACQQPDSACFRHVHSLQEASNGDARGLAEGANNGGSSAGQMDLTRLPTDPNALLHLLQLGLQCVSTNTPLAAVPKPDTAGLVSPGVRSPSPPARSPVRAALLAAANNLRPPSSCSSSSRWEGPAQQQPVGQDRVGAAAGPQYGLAAWAQAIEDAIQTATSSSSSSSMKDLRAAASTPRNIRTNSLQRRYQAGSSLGGLPVQVMAPMAPTCGSNSIGLGMVWPQQPEQQQEQGQGLQQEDSLPPHPSPSLGDLFQQPTAAAESASGRDETAEQMAGTTSSAAAGCMPQVERRRLAVALLAAAGELLQGAAVTGAAQPASSIQTAAAAAVPVAERCTTPAGWFTSSSKPSSEAAADACMGGAGGVRYSPWAPGSPAAAALAQQQPEALQRQVLLQLSARMRAAVLSDPRSSSSAMVQAHNGSSETSFITGKKVTGSNIQLMRGSALGTGLEGGVAASGRLHMDSNMPGNTWASPDGLLGERQACSGRQFGFCTDNSSNISPGPASGTAATSSRVPAAATRLGRDSSGSSRSRMTPERHSSRAPTADCRASSTTQWQPSRGRSPGRYSTSSTSSGSAQHCSGASRMGDILGHLSPSGRVVSSGNHVAGRHQRPQQLLRQLQQQQQDMQQGRRHAASSCPSPRGNTLNSSWSPGAAAAAAAGGGYSGRSPGRRAMSASGSRGGVTAGAWAAPSTPGSSGSNTRTWKMGPRPASAAAGAAGVIYAAGAGGGGAGLSDMQQQEGPGSPSGMNICRQAAHRSKSPRRRFGSTSPPARSLSPPLGGERFTAASVGGGGTHGSSRQRARSAPAVPRRTVGLGRASAAAGVSGSATTVWDVNRDALVFNMYNIRGAEEEEEEKEVVMRGGASSPARGTRYASPDPPTTAGLLALLDNNLTSKFGGTGSSRSRSQPPRPQTSAAAAAAGPAAGVPQGLLSPGFTQWGQLEAGRGQQLQLQLAPLQWQDVVPAQRQQSPGKRYSSSSTGAVKGACPATPTAAGAAAAAVSGVGWFATPPPPRTLAPRWEAAARVSPGHQSNHLVSSGLTGLAGANKAPAGRPRSPGVGVAGAAASGGEGASPVTRILAMRSPSPEILTEKWRHQTLRQQQQQQSAQQVPLAWSLSSPDRSTAAKPYMFSSTAAALTSQPWTPGASLAGTRTAAVGGAGGWSSNNTSSGVSLLATGAAGGVPSRGHTLQRSLAGSPDMLLRSMVAGSPVPAAAGGEMPGVFDLLPPSDQSLHVANLVTRPRSVGGLTVGSLPYNSLLSPSLVSPKHQVTPLASPGTSPPGTPLLGASRVTPGPTAAAAAAAAAGAGGVGQRGAYVQSHSITSRQGADHTPRDSGDDPGDWDPLGQLLASSPFAAVSHAGMGDASGAAGTQPRTTAVAAASIRTATAADGSHHAQQQPPARSGKQAAPQQQQQRQQNMEQSLVNQLPSPGWVPGATSSKRADAAPAGGRVGASSYTTAASAAAAGMHWFEGSAPSTSTLVAARKEAAHEETVRLASTLKGTQRAQQPLQQQQPLPQQQTMFQHQHHQQQQQEQEQRMRAYSELLEPTDLDSDSDGGRQAPQQVPYSRQQSQRQQLVTPVAPELVTGVPGMWRRSTSGSFEFTDGAFDSWGQVLGSPGGQSAATMPARGAAGAATRAGKAAATMPSHAGHGGVGVTSDRHKLASSLSSGKASASVATKSMNKRAPAGASAVSAGQRSLKGSGREYM
jgi:hypothetical protein